MHNFEFSMILFLEPPQNKIFDFLEICRIKYFQIFIGNFNYQLKRQNIVLTN